MIHNLTNPTDLSGLYFVFKGSTNLERKGIFGIAHLMEHLQCKNFDDLQTELQENGISWNAYTSSNHIVFYFTGLERYLAPYRELLIERMSKFAITETDLEKEKKIVIEEYLDSFTEQTSIHYLNFSRRFLGTYSPIGLKEDIESLTLQDCKDFYDLQYANPDCIINISKSYELQDNGLYKFNDRSNLLKKFGYDDSLILEPAMEYPDKSSVIWHREIEVDDQPLVGVACSMLISGLNSPLYQEVREKRGLVYYLQCSSSKTGSTGYVNIATMTSDKNIEELNSTITEVLANKEKYLTQKRFETIKKASLIAKEKREINRYTDISEVLSPESKKLYENLETLSLEEVYNVYDKYFDPSKFVINTDKELR